MSGYDNRSRHVLRHRRRRKTDDRLRRRREGEAQVQCPSRVPTVVEIFSAENLIRVFYRAKRKNGQAAGPDRVTFRDLGHCEVCEIMRELSLEILAGWYRASQRRVVRIAKRGGGYRLLSIRSLIHRVVGAALHEALTPYWESVFHDRSFGFRPKRSTWHVLAQLEHAVDQGYTVIGQDDVQHAFDEVRIPNVMDAHRQHIDDEQLLWMIEAVLRDPHRPNSNIGIDQGNPYSP